MSFQEANRSAAKSNRTPVPHEVKLIHKPYPLHRLLRLMNMPVEPLLPPR